MKREIDDIVQSLKTAKARGKGCTLLIGAGCSVEAGIPTAAGFVKIIKDEYPLDYNRAREKTYPKCMAELAFSERKDLIAHYVDNAKINWAHIGIAQLMLNGYVDRVLTTNFDPLVVRACSLLGHFPAVYDFAASQLLVPEDIPEQAIFYLHGQRSGFVIMNTEEECTDHSKRLEPVFRDAGRGRVWVVAGYSGENDPVFDHLANVKRFDNKLYWAGYKGDEPAKHLREKLLIKDKYAFYVNGYTADDLFVTIAQKLGCFPPDFACKPFTHLSCLLDMVTSYTLPGQDAKLDVLKQPREWIVKAINEHERCEAPPSLGLAVGRLSSASAIQHMMAGEYDKVISARAYYDNGEAPDLAEHLAWAYNAKGDMFVDEATAKISEETDNLYLQAYENYKSALEIKPEAHEVFNNWGVALSDQAKTKSGVEADELYSQAFAKYKAAVDIKPDKPLVLRNWGSALFDLARTKSGEEMDSLLLLACDKYSAAHELKPDDQIILLYWSSVLIMRATNSNGEQASSLYKMAKEKALEAEKLSPGFGSYNIACIHALQNNDHECRTWLEKSRNLGRIPSREHIEMDTDLDNIRNTGWYKDFMNTLPA